MEQEGGIGGDGEEIGLEMGTGASLLHKSDKWRKNTARIEALDLLKGLIQVSKHLHASEFRSDAAANLVWGLAKLISLLQTSSEGPYENQGFLSLTEEGMEKGPGIISLLHDLLAAFLAGQRQCQQSGTLLL